MTDPAKLSVQAYQVRWAELVSQVVRPTLQRLSEEYTFDPRKCASASPNYGMVWVLEVPERGNLCIAPEPGTGMVAIYKTRGESARCNSQDYDLNQVTAALIRERAEQYFGPLCSG